MYVSTSVRPLSRDELHYRRIVLRDAIICIGWIKLISIFCYTGLYLLVRIYSEGKCSTAIQYMILAIIPVQVLSALLLFLGAIEVKPFALKAALWLSLLLAMYTTVLGIIGAIYFIRYGDQFMHFLIAAIFAILSFSVCCQVLPTPFLHVVVQRRRRHDRI
ncbi:hypothetical protein PYW07_012425 [Mythimna separata]|uniref:Uncharacterized protein n=1 Tax=Mythimna separata TaxID=271217 RepID=A0AAD7YL60_MYTSE|nr:hypothetical protein PYW07_012425 [Mythimna separata]